MQCLGQRVAPHRQRQRCHDLDLIVVRSLQELIRDQADGQSEDQPPGRFLDEQPRHVPRAQIFPLGDLEQHKKHDDADAVVKQRFPGRLGLEAFGRAGGLEDAQHGDGIGGRNEGAKQQAVNERHGNRQPPKHDPRHGPDQQRRHRDPHRRQQRDRALLLP